MCAISLSDAGLTISRIFRLIMAAFLAAIPAGSTASARICDPRSPSNRRRHHAPFRPSLILPVSHSPRLVPNKQSRKCPHSLRRISVYRGGQKRVNAALAPSKPEPADLIPGAPKIPESDSPPLQLPDALTHAEELDDVASDDSKFVWERHWYPVALIEDLDPNRPTGFELLGIPLVLWKDETGEWKAFKDLCPHRLAPLSVSDLRR